MMKNITQTNIGRTSVAFLSFVLFAVAPGLQAQLNVAEEIEVCATAEESAAVQEYYSTEGRPDAPTPIPARRLQLPEVKVASGLSRENSYGVRVTPQQVKDIWTTIDGWGDRTEVHLVFTMGGSHVLDFPSLIPMRQEDLDDGWLDIYADNGDGVHGHLWLEPIRTVWAVDLPAKETGGHTRAISFFLPDGNLAISVYATLGSKKFDPAAIAGFERTRALLETMPRLCP